MRNLDNEVWVAFFEHTCGSRLRKVATVGVDPQRAVEVAVMKCDGCDEVLTTMETKLFKVRFEIKGKEKVSI
jgi:hypothetical protein